tara:strand:+ start:590 stop:763 length:174 start_codon:yes stop_codon:yes gene_type:complete
MTARKLRSLAEAAAAMGRKGGSAGTGKTKRRGNASYYRDMQRKSVQARLSNQAKKRN